jgi:hypothetical protein
VRVDATLAAPTTGMVIARLDVTLPFWKPQVAAVNHAAAPLLLQFASRRVAGELRISLLLSHRGDEISIVFPTCERATVIRLDISCHSLRFQLQPGGAFTALATLKIKNASVDGSELEDVVFSRCPRFKVLFLKRVTLSGAPSFSIRSDSVTMPQPAFNDYIVVGISPNTDAPSVGISLYRWTTSVAITSITIKLYRRINL